MNRSNTFYLFLVGYPPFSDSISGKPLNDQIIEGLYTFPDEFWSDVSDPAKDLIRKMMCTDPAKRLTMDGVLQHPWLADDLDNTKRVDSIMHPSQVAKTPPTVQLPKRSACDDAEEETAPATKEVMTTASESTYASGRRKRAKY